MNIDILRTVFAVLAPFGIGWAIWVTVSHMKARNDLDALKLYVAENYVKKDVIDRVFEKLNELNALVHTIAGRLNATLPKE